jgi:hypothetical protein
MKIILLYLQGSQEQKDIVHIHNANTLAGINSMILLEQQCIPIENIRKLVVHTKQLQRRPRLKDVYLSVRY